MALGKQGKMGKAFVHPAKSAGKNGGKVVGGGNVKQGVHVKPIAGNSKKAK